MTGPSNVRYRPHPHIGGRAAALRELAAWHGGGPRAPKVLLVTGDPGSGRSRLVSGFLMLCDPAFRAVTDLSGLDPATVPAVGPPAPRVFAAAGLTSAQLLSRVADELAPGARLTADVYERFAALEEESPTVVVVTDLDRVGVVRARDETARATRSVLSPLAQSPGVRLLAELPRSQAQWLAGELPPEHVRVVDLDEAPWADGPGLALQAAHTLGGGLPFAPPGPGLDRLAGELARTAGNALVVRLAAASVRSTPGAGPPQWPATVGEALDLHARRCGADELTLHRLLTPLALARDGAALPPDLWVRLASAVAGRDLSQVLADGRVLLAPFVERAEPAAPAAPGVSGEPGASAEPADPTRGGGGTVRLVHPAVGAELRDRLGTSAREAHRRITRTLLDTVTEGAPGPGPERWARARPYVREQLPGHALEAELLPGLLADPGFLLHGPQELLRATAEHLDRTGADLPPLARTWLRLAPLLIRSGAGPAQRAGLLEHACRQDGLPVPDFGPGLPWHTLWWHPLPEVTALTAAYGPDGAPAVVAALPAAEGHTYLGFDAATGAPVAGAEALARPGEEERAAARYVIGPEAGQVRIWARTGNEPVAVFLSQAPLTAADITPDGILLLADPHGIGALRVTAGAEPGGGVAAGRR